MNINAKGPANPPMRKGRCGHLVNPRLGHCLHAGCWNSNGNARR